MVAGSVQYEPEGHGVLSVVLPAAQYLPCVKHSVQDDAPAPLKYPAEHCDGEITPAAQKLPAGHVSMEALVEQYDPAGHKLLSVMLPAAQRVPEVVH